MNESDIFTNLWNYMELSEKQRLMRTFLSQHGDHFSRDDFLRFLALRYDGADRRVTKSQESKNTERSV
jgi:hypothetical protein